MTRKGPWSKNEIERFFRQERVPLRLARWLLSRALHETAIAIEPLALLSWDFRQRMGDAK